MRIPIREQLGLLVLITSLVSVAVLAGVVWKNNYDFVIGIRLSRLELAAALKTSQAAQSINFWRTAVHAVTTRVIIQNALLRYNRDGNNTAANWFNAATDLQTAVRGGDLIQAKILARNDAGVAGFDVLLNATSDSVGDIVLPGLYPNNNSEIHFGDSNTYGYPQQLYPVFQNSSTPNVPYPLNTTTFTSPEGSKSLLLGPLTINSTFSLFSITMPIYNNTSSVETLGYMTVLVNAEMLYKTIQSPEGLDSTGETLLVGPATTSNRFPPNLTLMGPHATVAGNDTEIQDMMVNYVIAPSSNSTVGQRHSERLGLSNFSVPFAMKDYPAIVQAYARASGNSDNADSIISTHNEQGDHVAVGFAVIDSMMVDWILVSLLLSSLHDMEASSQTSRVAALDGTR
jgi:osomolarity two-component system, sensor histidine kinase SLN1